MIDLHCHILPGIDDGARDLEDAVAMALQARAGGIGTVCATPHVRADHAVEIASLPTRVALVQAELLRRGIDVRIAAGGEVAQSEAEGLSDAELRAVSLGGAGGWILLEPAPGPLDARLELTVEGLAARGLRAVIAHPERHAGADVELRLRTLAAQGCLIQWTAAFVADRALREPVARWAGMGLVHLLGSDAHSARFGRPVALADGFAALRELLPEATVRWMEHEAPAAILRGEPVAPPPR
ncbi:MAG TPA: CpsB/CapC family capsule biosynthesis tyrosine phosphatase [Conexibacter sp.]|nr:CpsB/CapC family capsule biosynthesis tyrosine phosphatase [Conexibacter sp.]